MDSDWEIEYEQECVNFGDDHSKFKVMSISELPIEFLADLESRQEEISGRRLWPGSLILAQYLNNFQQLVEGKTIMELGAGSGICSMLARRLGSSFVAVTDGDEECIDLMRKNLNTNDFGDDTGIQCFHMRWGDSKSLAAFKEKCSAAQKFDTIIAGDVLYKRDLLQPFFSTTKEFLDENGQLILCHLPRAGVEHALVKEFIESEGFFYETIQDIGSVLQDTQTLPPGVEEEDVTAAQLYKIKVTI
mmetsp:Transcript_22505/g.29439  ORF Transcript_22505/g.29439 Transcript_22505/m.29439 type:complete len:246 (-) Transcript_22505:107-844(-)